MYASGLREHAASASHAKTQQSGKFSDTFSDKTINALICAEFYLI